MRTSWLSEETWRERGRMRENILSCQRRLFNFPYIFTGSSLKSVITHADACSYALKEFSNRIIIPLIIYTLPDGVMTCNMILRSLYTFHRAASAALRLLSQVSHVISVHAIFMHKGSQREQYL